MRGLTIIVTGADADRFRSALQLAAAHAALGGTTTMFLDEAAVPLARERQDPARDARHVEAGLPSTGDLLDMVLALGADVALCQTGLALHALTLAEMDSRLRSSGIVSILGQLGDDRLVAI